MQHTYENFQSDTEYNHWNLSDFYMDLWMRNLLNDAAFPNPVLHKHVSIESTVLCMHFSFILKV